jgi:hypothetical protein
MVDLRDGDRDDHITQSQVLGFKLILDSNIR